MSSSFLSWPKALVCVTIAFAGCSGPSSEWPSSVAVDDGGFSMRMPLASGAQNGTLVLGADTMASHINILADSGITYASSWFVMPERYRSLPAAAALDSIWPLIVERVGGQQLAVQGPLQTALPTARTGWFVNGDDIQLGVVVHAMDDRMVVMNAATPAPYFSARQERNMLRFLNSFERN